MVRVRRALVGVVLPLALGVLTYVAFRAPSVRVVTWFPRAVTAWLRGTVGTLAVPSVIVGSLPDAAWAFAFGAALALVWDGAARREKLPWLVAGALLAASVELGQLARIVPGTFDVFDLVAIVLGYAAAVIPSISFRTCRSST